MAKKTSNISKLDIELVAQFEEFGPLYRAFVGSKLPSGMSAPRLKLMAALAKNESMTMSDIRKVVGGSAQNVTGLVDTLESEGKVERSPHPTDRRKTLIRFTQETEAEVLKQRNTHWNEVGQLFTELTDTEKRTLSCVLTKLVDSLSR
ncbi:MAG: MarR family transcriptional regulator [Cyanobacteria bacterium P01_C01_bin.38]